MDRLFHDVRYAFRQLRRAPGFTVATLLTLAIGIGAATAIFTLVYDVLLKPLPYPHPGQLVVMEEQVAEFRDIYPKLPLSANHFVNWQRNSRSFQSMAALREQSLPLGIGGHPLQVEVVSATPGIFPVLAAAPQLGRPFTAQEAQPGRDRVVVLMNDLWRTQFQSDPRIVGKTVTLNGFPYTVIGAPTILQSPAPPSVRLWSSAPPRAFCLRAAPPPSNPCRYCARSKRPPAMPKASRLPPLKRSHPNCA